MVFRSVVTVKHTYFESAGTPEAEMIRFLRGKAESILSISHPFPDATRIPPNTIAVEYGPDGEVTRRFTAPAIRGNDLLFYLKDGILSLWYVLRTGRVYDLYAGSDNLNTFAGILLRMLGRVRRVAYYVIDFTPVRFRGKLMNAVYQAVNRFCCYHADFIWNVSPAMIAGRESIGIRESRSAPQLTVPLGCDYARIRKYASEAHDPHALVYFGTLRDEHGPGLAIEALPLILLDVPDAALVYAGGGELEGVLKARAEELGVAERVRFLGFVPSDEEVYRVLSGSGLALATYPPDDHTYKRFCDPGKVKIYLACGLPVLATDVPAVARELASKGAGAIVAYTPESLAEAAVRIFRDQEGYRAMCGRALDMAREYDWDTIWQRVFEETGKIV
jgi:glycosyltransferase involved in cell wall biosynthesis